MDNVLAVARVGARRSGESKVGGSPRVVASEILPTPPHESELDPRWDQGTSMAQRSSCRWILKSANYAGDFVTGDAACVWLAGWTHQRTSGPPPRGTTAVLACVVLPTPGAVLFDDPLTCVVRSRTSVRRGLLASSLFAFIMVAAEPTTTLDLTTPPAPRPPVVTPAEWEARTRALLSSRLDLDAVDVDVSDYVVSALADAVAAEDDAVAVVAPFLQYLARPGETSATGAAAVDAARSLRRELHGVPESLSEGGAADQPQRLAKPKRLGAAVGFHAGAEDGDGKGRRRRRPAAVNPAVDGGGNANATLDRSLEAAKAKDAADVRRSRRTGAQLRSYTHAPTEAAVGSIKAKIAEGTRDVHIEGIDLSFGGLTLLSGASLHLAAGRRYGVIGRNGIGKSTLMRALARRELPLPPDMDVLYVEQEVAGNDQTPLQCVLSADEKRTALLAEEAELTAKLDTLDPAGEERLSNVYAALSEMDADSAEASAASILDGLGFSTTMMRDMRSSEFSGGWRMRIALARALFGNPRLLLADEPTNHLDLHTVLWLSDYLTRWEGTLVVVSHDRDFLNTVCTDIVYVKDKLLHTYSGNYDDFERARLERLKEVTRAAESFEMRRAHVQKFVDKFRANAKRAAMAQSRIKLLQRMEEDRVVLPGEEEEFAFSFPEPGPLTGSHGSLQLSNVTFGYAARQRVAAADLGDDTAPPPVAAPKILFQGVDFSVDMDSRAALVGPNGAGKTTLLKLLLGDNVPSEGNVKRSTKLRVGYFSQHHVEQLVLWRTPLEHMKVTFPAATNDILRGHLHKLGVSADMALRPISTLSGGQKSRVALAVITYSNPHILLLDEYVRLWTGVWSWCVRPLVSCAASSHCRRLYVQSTDVVVRFCLLSCRLPVILLRWCAYPLASLLRFPLSSVTSV